MGDLKGVYKQQQRPRGPKIGLGTNPRLTYIHAASPGATINTPQPQEQWILMFPGSSYVFAKSRLPFRNLHREDILICSFSGW